MNKRLPILSLLCLLCILSSKAQDSKKLTITGEANKLNSGFVARLDQNGNYCAAIQVISDMDGFSYDSNDGIVGKVENKPGKDIVYLTASERVLEIFKNGYEPLKIILSEHGITLKQKQVWQIKIVGEETANNLPVTFRFTPEDANLFIDGENIGTNLTKNLSTGEHSLRIERNGYQTIDEIINVSNKRVFFEWEMKKTQDAGIQITTNPDGATIYLDGVRLGESPIATYYPSGNYPIKITKDGYLPIEDDMFEVILPQTQKSYSLEENVGYLTINTRPEATVYFNDEMITDPTHVKLSPQIVIVKVTMPKAEDLEEQVVLKKDDNKILNFYPDIQTGTIQVAVTPFDADIELKGDAGEHYTAKGMKIFENIPVGTYSIKVSNKGHKTTEEIVLLKADDKLNKSIILEKGRDVDFGIEMVFVKGGTFTMGCKRGKKNCEEDEYPPHLVTLSDFYVGKYEVTLSQFKTFIDETSYLTDAEKEGYVWTLRSDSKQDVNWKYDQYGKLRPIDEFDHPVIYITKSDAEAYCNWLSSKTGKNYRLPTEAEWEYAAKGGQKSKYFIYSGSNNLEEVAWSLHNSTPIGKGPAYRSTHSVGQLKPNELGIYDMSGNVWELCSDNYSSKYYKKSPENNPKGDKKGCSVVRGGSFFVGGSPTDCKITNRKPTFGGFATYNVGFRLVYD